MKSQDKQNGAVETEAVFDNPDLSEQGGEVPELVVIEELVRQKKHIPQAKKYRIRIDKKHYEVTSAIITGREILALAAKNPDEWKLYQIRAGHQPTQIAPDEIVDLRKHGIERFSTMPRDSRDGQGPAFQLPASDREFLENSGLKWRAAIDGGNRWLILEGWKLPTGYNHTHVRLGLLVPPSYPDDELDMVYVYPDLARLDGKGINNLSQHHACGIVWQRWSRHRTEVNPWRPGVDDLASHLSLVDDWFRREFEKG